MYSFFTGNQIFLLTSVAQLDTINRLLVNHNNIEQVATTKLRVSTLKYEFFKKLFLLDWTSDQLNILEARAEIVKKHQSLHGRIEGKKNGLKISWPLTAFLQGKQSSDIWNKCQ